MKDHDFQHTYSGIYPDGSLIKSELCHDCGLITLTIRRAHEAAANTFVINQIQANEIAYALLKGNNKFMHILEDQVQSAPMDLIPGVASEDQAPPNPVRQGV